MEKGGRAFACDLSEHEGGRAAVAAEAVEHVDARRHLAAREEPRHGAAGRVQRAALRVDDDAAERTVRRGRDGNAPLRRIIVQARSFASGTSVRS